jgi:hypothetical protein
MRVIGLDISIAGTGYADWTDTRETFTTARIGTDPQEHPTLLQRHHRLKYIEDAVAQLVLRPECPTLIVVEGPSMGSIQGAHDISGNWWRIVSRLLANTMPVMEVPPLSLKRYATGSGSSRGATKVTKRMVTSAVNERYLMRGGIAVRTSDEADAVILAAIGLRMLGHPADPDIPAKNLTSLAKLHLPEGLPCL